MPRIQQYRIEQPTIESPVNDEEQSPITVTQAEALRGLRAPYRKIRLPHQAKSGFIDLADARMTVKRQTIQRLAQIEAIEEQAAPVPGEQWFVITERGREMYRAHCRIWGKPKFNPGID